ncbi:hypothetical protein [Erythrobacter rubeus]|uniref:Uncharacterized protein n=1 Tax=Erythrobacter rubeus TaxID=2760803 RepID=A0ABR8KZE8_9SPHN|nr:hypothetical protein [Erythrobacter rubeus]MBD2843541.1 hypothetical protein [Erythrobacter rubeus]
MSRSIASYLDPFNVAGHPSLEPEVKRAILASWAFDKNAVENQPAMRHPPDLDKPVSIDDILDAMRTLDRQRDSPRQSGRMSD